MAKMLLAALAAAALLAGLGCGDDGPPDADAQVTRQVLAAATSLERAADQELGLSRVVVPPGQRIASHTHPGVQMAFIAEGVLTYSVHSGEAIITRHAGTPREAEERVAAGSTVNINPGDSLVELPGMIHSARNDGKEAVVIYISSLFEEGAAASSAAEAPGR